MSAVHSSYATKRPPRPFNIILAHILSLNNADWLLITSVSDVLRPVCTYRFQSVGHIQKSFLCVPIGFALGMKLFSGRMKRHDEESSQTISVSSYWIVLCNSRIRDASSRDW